MTRLVLDVDQRHMVRRSPTRHSLDDRAFPIRVIFRDDGVSAQALLLTEAQAWLNENIGRGQWAMHGQSNIGLNARGIYFRTLADAERFFTANPRFELYDTTDRSEHLKAARGKQALPWA